MTQQGQNTPLLDTRTEFAELLELLGIGADERVSVCSQKPGGRFEAVIPVNRGDAEAVALSTPYAGARDVWFGVNPVAPPEGYRGRGTVEHVARCSALFADVDLKAGGVADPDVADAVCNALAAALGQPPAAVVFSGHGGHPYWTLDADDPAWTLDTEAKRGAAVAIFRRFHRLCADVAARFGGRVDNVGELSRVLRVPGTYNRKNPGAPIRVELRAWPYGTGGPLTFAEVAEALDAYGVPEQPEDHEHLGAVVSEPAGWQFGAETDPYVAAMVAGWPDDLPAARHGWLTGQAVRLACARRLGLITEADHAEAVGLLGERFDWLLTHHGQPRKPTPANEVASALTWGMQRAATFTDDRAARDLGVTLLSSLAVDHGAGIASGASHLTADQGNGTDGSAGTDADGDDAKMPGQARFTDAGLAEIVTDKALRGRFLNARGLGWLHWTGTHWRESGDGPPTEAVRRFVIGRMRLFARKLAANPADGDLLDAIEAWKKVASAARIAAVLKLAGNLIEVDADALDADPDVLNTPSGVVDLRTGELHAHDPARLMTRITAGAYRPGYHHPDVDQALAALPEPERGWFQRRIGQAITGRPTPDGVVPLLYGGGSNGKSALSTGGLVPAFGGYGHVASHKLITADKGNDHSTERADLRGRRLVVGEELTEGRSLDMTAIKRIMDTPVITARYCRQDNMTFAATHSLFINTNYRPIITETDHGTWRRLALLPFPYTYRTTEAEITDPATEFVGDATIKERIKDGATGQHDALVTWAVDGAVAWYASPETALLPTETVKAATLAWRADADRILGYWTERLVADRDGKVLATELLADFNRWLTENGHREWSKETFGPRFENHQETHRNGVERGKPRSHDGLSRPQLANDAFGTIAPPIKGRPWLWLGVRFRTDADDAADELRRAPEGHRPTHEDVML
ncbi:DNA primase family protein [[Mycobacterium] crassicus]|uniref:Phage/plasmid primase, P4 family n=1 Tax=[Mycobacterium] crassicus TaxID=2872309 RepID=A0ABU5XF41_9MYCO|nr:phage/plasmid primase, P4 family [Mycolicibacter sp. MYC098]MEB3020884.1 phage/plasmid primase, P4 family [Mycolicibacter sp. MYC098]